jgi:hypothetical protein
MKQSDLGKSLDPIVQSNGHAVKKCVCCMASSACKGKKERASASFSESSCGFCLKSMNYGGGWRILRGGLGVGGGWGGGGWGGYVSPTSCGLSENSGTHCSRGL